MSDTRWPETSVIIPTHNRPERLLSAVKSVSNQTIKPKEIIVVNDGSDVLYDETIENLPKGEFEYNYIKCSTSGGAAQARNIGAEAASGDVYMFLDDDDQWRPQKIEGQLSIFKDNSDIGLVYSGRIAVDENGAELYQIDVGEQGNLSGQILLRNYLGTTSGVAVTADAFNAVDGFDAKMPALQDWDLWIRTCQKTMVGVDEQHTVEWTIHTKPGDQMTSEPERYVNAIGRLKTKHSDKISALDNITRRKVTAYQYSSIADKYARAGSTRRFEYIVRSLISYPTVSALSRVPPRSYLTRLRTIVS